MIKQVALLLVIMPSIAFPQGETSNLKPIGGEKTLEVQLTPFGNTPVGISGIRARWFRSDSRAFRLNLFLGLDSDTQITQQEDSNFGTEELKDKTSVFAISLRPGFENHINATERLAPYFGLEFELSYQSSTDQSEQQIGSNVNYTKVVDDNGFVRMGANAIAGMDYYVAKKLYVGTEFGFGFSYTKFSSLKIKSDLPSFVEPDPEKQGNSLDVGPNVVAQIRLGYAF